MLISELPDSTLVEIFELLNASQRIRIENVCRRWNRLSKFAWTKFHTLTDSSFQHGSLTAGDGPTLGKVLKKTCTLKTLLNRCGNYLKTLKFKSPEPKACKYDILRTVARFCPNLEKAEFFEFSIDEWSLRRFAFRCGKLKSVTFSKCFKGNFSNIDAVQFFQNCRNLKLLDLSFHNELIGDIFRGCLPHQLEYLNLSGCRQLQKEAVKGVANRCLNLRSLNLNYCGVSTECLEYAFQRLTKLQVVSLEDYDDVDDELSDALSNLSELQKLILRNNRRIDDDTLATVSRSCLNLRVLDVSDCEITDVGLQYLPRLHRLVELNLSHCNVTDIGVKMLSKLRNLETLCLSWCNEITDEAVTTLAISCCNLRNLDLTWTSVTVVSIAIVSSLLDRMKYPAIKLLFTGPIVDETFKIFDLL